MILGGTRYLLITIMTAGLIVYLWVGNNGPLNPKHISLNSHEEVLALEDTLVAHYASKLDGDYIAPTTPLEKVEEIRVVLQSFEKRLATIKEQAGQNNAFLKVVASISAPVFQGQKLQASDMEIVENLVGTEKGTTTAFIGYNMVGPENFGAVQIISLREVVLKGNKGKPQKQLEVRLLQTALLKDSEVHGLTIVQGKDKASLIIAGQTSDESFTTPAFVESLKLLAGKIEGSPSVRIDLPSFAATSVIEAHDHIFVSVGDDNGGIVQLGHIEKLKVGSYQLKDIYHEFFELQDARGLAANGHSVYAVSGGQSSLWSKRFVGKGVHGGEVHSTLLEGGLLPEAKSSIEVTQTLAYIGLGDGGTQIISLNNMNKSGEIPQMVSEELDSTLTVTNSVGVSGKELFTADGEAGSRLFHLTSPTTLEQVAHIKFAPKTSVNAVKKTGDYVVFAIGLGGVKIARHYQ